ncbi:MAG: hypothetical protein ACRDHY_11190, partial [Anaerolineales bacterium]
MNRPLRLMARALPLLIVAGCARAGGLGARRTADPAATLAAGGTRETAIARVDFEAMVPDSFAVSPDGRQVAYSARYRDGSRVFLGLAVSGPYDQIQEAPPVFSLDSRRLAYVAEMRGQRYVIVDGDRLGPYPDVGVPIFSADSTELAFVVKVEAGQAVVAGGEALPAHEQVNDLRWSPDGRLAYAAREGDEWFAVVDGEAGPGYDEVYLPAELFGRDGRRYAYVGVRGDDWHVVVDGEEHGPYAAVGERGPVFSPDGSRLAYLARAGEWWRVVVDGEAGRLFDEAGAPAFSADGGHWMHPAAWGGRSYLMFDGESLGPYAAVAPSGGMAFGPEGERHVY